MNDQMIPTTYPRHERIERKRWMELNADAVRTFADSRLVDKIFETFEQTFEDTIIDTLGIPAGDDDDENDQAMDIIYDVINRCVMERYALKPRS